MGFCDLLRHFFLDRLGVLAPGSADVRPSAQPPIDTSGNFLAHTSAESPSNISPKSTNLYSWGLISIRRSFKTFQD